MTALEKEEQSCYNCQFFQTKSVKWKKNNQRFEEIFRAAQYFRRKRDSKVLDASQAAFDLPCEIFDTILIIDALEESYKESLNTQMTQTLKILELAFTKKQ